MTREEEIQIAAEEYAIYTNDERLDAFPEATRTQLFPEYNIDDLADAFNEGAKWADEHPTKKQIVTINAWVAREKEIVDTYNTDLFIAKQKPERLDDMGSWTNYDEFLSIDMSSFPTITWENSPQKVRVTIEMEEEE